MLVFLNSRRGASTGIEPLRLSCEPCRDEPKEGRLILLKFLGRKAEDIFLSELGLSSVLGRKPEDIFLSEPGLSSAQPPAPAKRGSPYVAES